MKQFILVRHAKSSWEFPELKDIDRPLNKRGKNDAPKMGRLLRTIVPKIGTFYSSPGKRAHDTAKEFAKAYERDISSIMVERELYFGEESDIMDIIHQSASEDSIIIMFSHNPTSTYFVNRFTDDYLDNLPTCGIAIFQSEENEWNKIHPSNTKLIKLLRPKFDL